MNRHSTALLRHLVLGALLALLLGLGGAGGGHGPAGAPALEGDAPGEREEARRADSPGEWARFRRAQQADEQHRVDPAGLVNAVNQRRAILRQSILRAGGRVLRTAGIGAGGWRSIGPGGVGGRIRSIAIDPRNPARMFIGSVSGGIWRSTDAGASWAPVNDFMGNLAVSTIVISPLDSNLMYAGTGEGFYNADAVMGGGLFKSTDGGQSWALLASTSPALNGDWLNVNRLALHPTLPGTLLAATAGGLYASGDAGVTWVRKLSGSIADVVFNPSNGNQVLVGVRVGSLTSSAVWYSADGGATFRNSNLPGTGRAEVAFGRTLAYAVADNSNGELWVSGDGGAGWTRQSTPGHLGNQGWYANALWVSPVSDSDLVVGGLDLYRSRDGGLSWVRISDWVQARMNGASAISAHADQHAIVASPAFDGSANRRVYFANDGGLFVLPDLDSALASTTSGWVSLNDSLMITQFYGAAGHHGYRGRVVGGAQDNGDLVIDEANPAGATWFSTGDGGYSDIDPTDGSWIYGEYVRLELHRGQLGAPTQSIWVGIGDAGATKHTANFIAPFTLDHARPTVMYAGGRSLWRTQNVRDPMPAWTALGTFSDALDCGVSSCISAITVAPSDSNVVWLGTGGGALYGSVDATGSTPTFVRAGQGVLPARMLHAITVDRDNPSIVYVGFGGYTPNNLWRSTDGGTTWTSLSAGLPAAPVYSVERHPANPNALYVGTEVGVYASSDGGNTWSTTNDGPANVPVVKLVWLDATTLLASTHGRGMFEATVQAPASDTTLAVGRTGNGSGTVSSSPAGISCGTTCVASFAPGSRVTLAALPAAGSTFTGWSGACTGTAPCTLSMTAPASVTATFSAPITSYAVSVSRAGIGGGVVTSSPGGLVCGASCTAAFATGSLVTLNATAAVGSTFTGWSGACSGTGACLLTMNAAKAVTATFGLATGVNSVAVTRAGTGTGTVTSLPSSINCGVVCAANFAAGSSVMLSATAASGSTFAGWSGACTGSGTCVLAASGAKAVTATFTASAPGYAATVSRAGTGSGTVTSSPAGLSCGATCTASFAAGTSVTLAAAPLTGSTFAGWSGACTGTGSCVLAMTAAKAVTATFNTSVATSYAATVTKAGTGGGLVTSSPAGINCGASCSASVAAGSTLTLTAAPLTGSTFAGWSGACTGTGSCVLAMTAAKAVTATFNTSVATSYAATVTKAGTGGGLVTSSPAGINCGASCSASVAAGSTLTLTAAPLTGSTFAGWSGACTGSGSCVLAMTAAKAVTATFNTSVATSYAATVTKAGTGGGLVTSSPAGINCGASCSASVAAGSTLTLTAAPLAGSTFAGWSGACTGTGSCVLAMTAAKAVTATFNTSVATSYAATVTKAGTGGGLVTSSPAGINCGASCSASVAAGSTLTLTAAPLTGSTFAGWSGACTGTGSCVLAMTAAKAVTATFNASGSSYLVTVTKAGSGTGTVTSTSGAVNCGTSCTATVAAGTTVLLLASPASGSTFGGWSGACGGTGICVLSVTAAKSVTASFLATGLAPRGAVANP